MPELPEVETIVREMRASDLEGVQIIGAEVYWDRTIAEPLPDLFKKKIVHRTINKISRRGKFIVFELDQGALLVHLRMTGKFLFGTKGEPLHSHERVRLFLKDGRILRYEDQRKFGKWHLLDNPEAKLDALGIEPLSEQFTLKAFQELIQKSHRQVKPFLLDQSHLVGLGNIYVDEALWLAKIHPLRLTSSLTKAEVQHLYKAIPEVLQKGIENTGTSLGANRANYFSVSGRRGNHQHQLNVFRRETLPCPCCQHLIKKIIVGQRGTHFCPHCQQLTDS